MSRRPPTSPLARFLAYVLLASVLSRAVARDADDVRRQEGEEEEEASIEYTSDAAFRDAVLGATNRYRRQHNAARLRWDERLAEEAREWSERCVFEHSGGATGENLAAGYPNASAAVEAWAHERVEYDFEDGGFDKKTGHFTQLVWKATTAVGCARTYCDTRSTPGWYLVCEYAPPGNVQGAFGENVQERVDGEGEEEEEEEEESGAAAGRQIGGRSSSWLGLWVVVGVGALNW